MTAKDFAASAGIVALLGAVITAGIVGIEAKDAPPVKVSEAASVSEAVALADGGIGYLGVVEVDGGRTAVLLTAAPCVRRRADAGSPAECMARSEDGGTRDPGPLNRFPASLAVGLKCQPVACAVTAGENADGEEKDLPRVAKARAGKVEALPLEVEP